MWSLLSDRPNGWLPLLTIDGDVPTPDEVGRLPERLEVWASELPADHTPGDSLAPLIDRIAELVWRCEGDPGFIEGMTHLRELDVRVRLRRPIALDRLADLRSLSYMNGAVTGVEHCRALEKLDVRVTGRFELPDVHGPLREARFHVPSSRDWAVPAIAEARDSLRMLTTIGGASTDIAALAGYPALDAFSFQETHLLRNASVLAALHELRLAIFADVRSSDDPRALGRLRAREVRLIGHTPPFPDDLHDEFAQLPGWTFSPAIVSRHRRLQRSKR